MEETGMTDLQFKSYIRELIATLEKAMNGGNTESDIRELVERLKRSLEY